VRMAEKGQTPGNPNTPYGVKVYYKPSMGRIIFRKPGVLRRSERVLAVNKQLEALREDPNHPAKKCKGKPWREFVKCLKREMDKAISKVS